MLWPGKGRTYFYLAYGTNSPAGIEVFRQSEKACVAEQEEVARDILDKKSERQSGMTDLFRSLDVSNDVAFRHDRRRALAGLEAEFEAWLRSNERRRQNEVLALLMQRPLVYRADCMALIRRAEQDGKLSFSPGARTAKSVIGSSPW